MVPGNDASMFVIFSEVANIFELNKVKAKSVDTIEAWVSSTDSMYERQVFVSIKHARNHKLPYLGIVELCTSYILFTVKIITP